MMYLAPISLVIRNLEKIGKLIVGKQILRSTSSLHFVKQPIILAKNDGFVGEAYSQIGNCYFFPAQELVEENSKISMDDPKYAANEAKIKEY